MQRPSIVYRVKDWLDRRWFRGITRDIPGASLAVLDVGGGTGQQLATLKAADARVSRTVIVDLDDKAEAVARAAGHEYVRARIEDASLRGPFDVILLLNLIEHVEDPLAVLTKVRALLSPRGVVLIKTPNYDSLDAHLFRHRNWGGYHCPRHWVIFTQPSFQRLVESSGLRVKRWQYTQGAPFWTVSVLAWLADRGVIRVTRGRPAWTHPLYAPVAAAFAEFDFTRGFASRLSQMTFALTST
jgi:SAM-dependent methyltransferase